MLFADGRDQRYVRFVGKTVRICRIEGQHLQIVTDARDAVCHMAVIKQRFRRILSGCIDDLGFLLLIKMIAAEHGIQHVVCRKRRGAVKPDRRQIRLKARPCRGCHRFRLDKIEITVVGIAPCDRQRRGTDFIAAPVKQRQKRIDQLVCRGIILWKGCGIQLHLIPHNILDQRHSVGVENRAAPCFYGHGSACDGDLLAVDGDRRSLGRDQLQIDKTYRIKSEHGKEQHRKDQITEHAFLARFFSCGRCIRFFCDDLLCHGTTPPFRDRYDDL